MTNQERWNYFDSGVMNANIAIELLDWAGYWTNMGLGTITDATKRQQMRWAINEIFADLGYMVKIVAGIAISYSEIKDAVEPTEQNIKNVVTDIMSFRLDWVTNIFSEE